jgi:hypothetical protein
LESLPGLADLRKRTAGEARIKIGVLDGPADLRHPALRGARLAYLGEAPPPSFDGPAAQHGTHVASIIFGQLTAPARGVAPNCSGLLRPIFSDDPGGELVPCSYKDLAAAIVAMADAGAHLINLSAGARLDPSAAPTCLSEAVLHCERLGCLIVAAAGNDGCAECLHVPGGMPSPAVLVVGAMDAEGRPLEFSNWGDVYDNQGILAPGQAILAAVAPDRWEARSGTSYATAVVSGVCGLLLSLQVAAGLAPAPRKIREALLSSALGCSGRAAADCSRLLAGRLSIPGALSALGFHTGDPTVSDLAESPSVAQGTESLQATAEAAPPNERSLERAVHPCGAADAAVPDVSAGGGAAANDGAAGQPPPEAQPSVKPSDCGCGCGGKGPRQLVYVVGTRLEYDFGTRVRQESLEDNFRAGFLDEQYRSLLIRPNLVRYLLGWDGKTGAGEHDAETALPTNGRLFDAKSVHWVLYQDDCPAYAIAPQGPFAEVAYKELIYFFVENQGISLTDYGISPDCINEYLKCHGGLNDPLGSAAPAERKRKKKGDEASSIRDLASDVGLALTEDPSRVARIAIAGEIAGRVALSTGESVEVIRPDMRGTASWNTQRLLEVLSSAAELPSPAAALAVVTRIVAALYEATRNPGKSPEDRAINYSATAALRFIRPFLQNGVFTDTLGGLQNTAIDSITVRPSGCQRTGMEYDVDLSFYSFENTLRGVSTLTSTVDVSDVVPVSTGRLRFTTRR